MELSTRLLNTVYCSLGTLANVTALLIGFGWFANFRVYERDKGAMRTELLTDAYLMTYVPSTTNSRWI